MTDQAQRLEIATVRAEIGSNITYRFNNDAIDALLIPTDSGNIKNLKQVIADIQQEGAEKISFATKIYPTTAAGISATVAGEIFLVAASNADEIYAVWQNTAGVAVDTGKRAISASAVIAATDAAQASANDAQTAASEATAKVAPFLSPASIDPVARGDGSDLQPGDTYFNTIIQAIKVYSTSGWVAANVTGTDLSAAINTREPTISTGSSGQFWAGDKAFKNINKSDVGLSNLDNTSDINKPVSIAQQNALDLKPDRDSVSISVANITALKSLSTSSAKYAYRQGYSLPGDGGHSFWRFDSSSVATPDDVKVIAPNNGAGRWLLNHNGIISVKLGGAKGDGVTDDFAAITRVHAAFPDVHYPAGNYVVSARLQHVAPYGMYGSGVNITTFTFTGATKGIRVIQNSAAGGVYASGATLLTNSASTTHVGLMIDGSPQYNGDDTALRIIGDRTAKRAYVSHIDTRGTTDNAGWGMGVQFHSIINFSAEDLSNRGVIPANPLTDALIGHGVVVSGNGAVVDFSLRRIWGFYSDTGILMPDYLEGGHIYDYEFVAVRYGILGRYTSGISVLPSSICGSLGMHIGQGHVNCQVAGVLLEKQNQSHVVNQNIYLQTRSIDAPGICVYLTGGNWITVDSIFCNGDSALNTKSLNSGVILSGCGLSTVTNVSGSSLLSAITCIDSSNNFIDNIRAAFCTHIINTNGGSVANKIGRRYGQGITGVELSVSGTTIVPASTYTLSFTIAFSGQATFVQDIPLPDGMFASTPDFGYLVAANGSIGFNIQYVYDASSATNAKFFISPISPAANLGSAVVRFGCSVSGK